MPQVETNANGPPARIRCAGPARSARALQDPGVKEMFAKLGAEFDNLFRSFVPPEEVCQHFTNARVELLKGVRAMIDARITHLSSEGRKGVSITIE